MRRIVVLLFLLALAIEGSDSLAFAFAFALVLVSSSVSRGRQSLARWQESQLCGTDHNDIDCDEETNDDSPSLIRNREFLDRRSFLRTSPSIFLGLSSSLVLLGDPGHLLRVGSIVPAAAAKGESDTKFRSLPDPIVKSLVYERVLGAGSYKTVYLVSATIPVGTLDDNQNGSAGSTRTVRYAMAVERLRKKRDVKNAFRGINIPDLIREGLEDGNTTTSDGGLFETIVDWWVQSSNVPEFAEGRQLFPVAAAVGDGTVVVDLDKAIGRTRSKPRNNFVGSRWMLSFKPVYETDLKRFIRNSPALYPIGGVNDRSPPSDKLQTSIVQDDYWTEPVLIEFVLDTLRAGKLMHDAGIVHRDIKPKNMMISLSPSSSDGRYRRRPVIIDYGFSEMGSPTVLGEERKRIAGRIVKEKEIDICVVHPGQLKGEVDYVLAEDLANYRGCQRGDTYAMGKTLYEFIFGSVELQQRRKQDGDQEGISVDAAELQNKEFRKLLFEHSTAGNESRFHLSLGAADCLLSILRGLCSSGQQNGNALSFAEAEQILSEFTLQSHSS